MRRLLILTSVLFVAIAAVILIIIPPHSVSCDRSQETRIGFIPESHTIIVTRTDIDRDKGVTARVELWKLNDEKASQIYRFADGAYNITAVGYSPDGTIVAVANDIPVKGNYDGMIKLWETQSGRLLLSIGGIPYYVGTLVFSPDSKELLAGLWDGTVLLWNTQTGKLLHTLRGHSDAVFSAAFSPDGKTIITGSRDTTAIVWEAKTGSLLHILRGHYEHITSLAFSPDSKTVITGSFDQSAILWDAQSGDLLHTLRGHRNTILSATFFSDRDLVIIGSADTAVTMWYVKTGKIFGGLYNHNARVNGVVYISDNMSILTSSNEDGTVALYDAQTSALLRWLCPRTLNGAWVVVGWILGLLDLATLVYLLRTRI